MKITYKFIGIFIAIILTALLIFKFINNNISDDKDMYSKDYYEKWKKSFIVAVDSNRSKVIDPQRNNITVSEGMGYGMLFAVALNDSVEFDKLWNFTKNYLDEYGLMNWQIDESGKVIGEGSASDADEDIAYALHLAAKKWDNKDYSKAASDMINSIKKYDISSEYILLPGDKWRDNIKLNPSYIAPLYYLDFQNIEGQDKNYWKKVSEANISLLEKHADKNTGLLTDWINEDGSVEDKDNILGYDSVRVPIRLLSFYKRSEDSRAKNILLKQEGFLNKIGVNNLVAGYSTTGEGLQSYINTTYLASYTSSALIKPKSSLSKELIEKLKESDDNSYYGSSLKLWVILIEEGSL